MVSDLSQLCASAWSSKNSDRESGEVIYENTHDVCFVLDVSSLIWRSSLWMGDLWHSGSCDFNQPDSKSNRGKTR